MADVAADKCHLTTFIVATTENVLIPWALQHRLPSPLSLVRITTILLEHQVLPPRGPLFLPPHLKY